MSARVWVCWECNKCGKLIVTGPSETPMVPVHEHQDSIFTVAQSAERGDGARSPS